MVSLKGDFFMSIGIMSNFEKHQMVLGTVIRQYKSFVDLDKYELADVIFYVLKRNTILNKKTITA